jgi:hypothetical protein
VTLTTYTCTYENYVFYDVTPCGLVTKNPEEPAASIFGTIRQPQKNCTDIEKYRPRPRAKEGEKIEGSKFF